MNDLKVTVSVKKRFEDRSEVQNLELLERLPVCGLHGFIQRVKELEKEMRSLFLHEPLNHETVEKMIGFAVGKLTAFAFLSVETIKEYEKKNQELKAEVERLKQQIKGDLLKIERLNNRL